MKHIGSHTKTYTHIFTAEQPLNKVFLQSERHIFYSNVAGNVPDAEIIAWDQNGEMQFFWSDQTLERMKSEGARLLDREKAKSTIKGCRLAADKYWKCSEDLLSAIKQEKGRRNIASAYASYTKALLEAYAYFLATHEYVTYALNERLKEELKQRFGKEADDNYIVLTTPASQDLLLTELKDWEKALRNPTDKNLLRHTGKFPFLFSNILSRTEALGLMRKRAAEKSLRQISGQIKESGKRRKTLQKKQKALLRLLKKDTGWFIREAAIARLLLKAC
jgi:hypothetical protein